MPPTDFFTPELAERYDERNSRLSKISECLHFLTGLALKEVPEKARVLCVGAGTGAEILSLAQAYPKWTFVAAEPSQSMLDVCRQRMTAAGLADRCEFIHGYVEDVAQTDFDVVTSVLVAHFIARENRPQFFKAMANRLKPGGYLVNAEISYDLDSIEFPAMLKNWEQVQALMGGTPESLANLPMQLRTMLTVLPNHETEELFKQAGIKNPVRFFQAFMITAWHGKKA